MLHKNSCARKNIVCLSRTHTILTNPNRRGEKKIPFEEGERIGQERSVWSFCYTLANHDVSERENRGRIILLFRGEISREGETESWRSLTSRQAGAARNAERTLFRHSSTVNGEDALSVTLLTLCHMAFRIWRTFSVPVIFIRFSLRYEIQHAVEVDNTRWQIGGWPV